MSFFDRLHPALQHHIVNSLGWRDLRPLQEKSIGPILEQRHVLLLAPTAGGKTEAAFFPILSRMLACNWVGLSVVYLCPLKALLNNLHTRLEAYCRWAGRRCELWHGDVSQGARRKILQNLPDCLLTTPESLEVMLVSAKTDNAVLFGRLRVVVVDEIHSFAGDDRGWHLLSILERLRKIAGVELQRVGLSATVGNPSALLEWLAGHGAGEGQVVQIAQEGAVPPDVQVDYTGSLENAATVISRLHHGEKRLVFCDSRSRVEKLATQLRLAGVETFVSHSSLSLDERQRAEEAFAQSSNCVIVATSTLELGIDVGDLDRVIQIDAPTTVASFLQRLGRTGRRPGAARNCLILATHREALLRGVSVAELWKKGFVEPIEPPLLPYHVFAQQILALTLQEHGLGRKAWREWLGRLPPFAQAPEGQLDEIVGHMISQGYLSEDQGIIYVGERGEARFGFQNYLELFSIFMRSPEVDVYFGREHLGSVDRGSFSARGETASILSLAGRSWKLREIDWKTSKALVEPADQGGKSRWLGSGRPYGFELCQEVKLLLTSAARPDSLSRRGAEALEEARRKHAWLKSDASVLQIAPGHETEWWTFAGRKANEHLGKLLNQIGGLENTADNFSLQFKAPVKADVFARALEVLRTAPSGEGIPSAVENEINLKFSECLPPSVLRRMSCERQQATHPIKRILAQPLRIVEVA